MELIVVKNDMEELLLDKAKVVAVLMNPDIQRVPGTDDSIRGISMYQNRLVVYYQFGKRYEPRCGVILKTDGEYLAGIVSEGVDVEERAQEELNSVVPGIWERRRDSIK